MKLRFAFLAYLRIPVALCFLIAPAFRVACAQEAPQKPAEKSAEQPAASTVPELSAQIELLETRICFETDGSSHKEVHARVKINSELGARQFARLNFDFNRAFEQIDIPLVRITHASGGTADMLPSAISDQPNPAVVNAPAYQDVRVKSVRILGLQPGDTLEYRVITTVTHAPLAPDFYLSRPFAQDTLVTQESYELDLPASLVDPAAVTHNQVRLRINPATPATSTSQSGEGADARVIYRWQHSTTASTAAQKESAPAEPDLVLTTFASWDHLSARLAALFHPSATPVSEITAKSAELTQAAKTPAEKLELLYEFVSRKIATIDLPLGASGFRTRSPAEILASGYATAEDKSVLFAALASAAGLSSRAALTGAPESAETQLPRPSLFTHILVAPRDADHDVWLDPSIEVAPYRMIHANFRGKAAFLLTTPAAGEGEKNIWTVIPADPPFAASQRVNVDAALAAGGQLTAKVRYTLRGDNELLLRVAFHQTTPEKWKDLAQLLSLSDGFRGQVSNVVVSDPAVTREPFSVQYEIAQPNFVDWSKKPVRVPALLPLAGLPDLPARTPAAGAAAPPIELGTPLDIDMHATLRLPPRAAARAPIGTSVQRDYATFVSQYTARNGTLSASRHLNFLLREISATRAADYNAFVHAVQNDQAQEFTLDRSDAAPAKPSDATPKTTAPKP